MLNPTLWTLEIYYLLATAVDSFTGYNFYMKKPYLDNHTKLDEPALQRAFIYNLNKIHPLLIKFKNQLSYLADESCYGDLENAIQELSAEVASHVARIDIIFNTLHKNPDMQHSISTQSILSVLVPDENSYLQDNLSKDLSLVFYIQKILSVKKFYYSTLKSIAGSLNNIDIKQYLQYSYDECESNQTMFKLIAKEYMESSINPFLC